MKNKALKQNKGYNLPAGGPQSITAETDVRNFKPMKAKLFFLFVAFTSNLIFGQIAVIQDKDGYTNVRQAPNSSSTIIHTIYENEVFWYNNEEPDQVPDWIRVNIPKNRYSVGCSDSDILVGWIHKSRLLPLEELEKAAKEDLQFEYILSDFDSKNRIIDYHDNKWVTWIDGRPIWGTDGNLPSIEVTGIHAKVENIQIEISPIMYSDIYQCNNRFQAYKNGDTYFLFQSNSDGAGYYEIVWVLTTKGLKQRLVGSLF